MDDGAGAWIDLHVHGGADTADDGEAVGRLLARMDGIGIGRAVLMSLDAIELGEGIATWPAVRRQCAAAGGRLLPAAAFDPRRLADRGATGIRKAVEDCAAEGAVVFGEYVPNLAVDDPLNLAVLAALEAVGLPVTIHVATTLGQGAYGLYDDPGLPRLAAALARFPGLTIIGHSQAFWSEIDARSDPAGRGGYPTGKVTPGRVVELMRRHPNLHADLSGRSGRNALERDPDHAAAFLAEFADRLYFATDLFPAGGPEPLLPGVLRDFVVAGRIGASLFRCLTIGNAARLLGRPGLSRNRPASRTSG